MSSCTDTIESIDISDRSHVLIIDDSSTIRHRAETFLEARYNVGLAKDGFDALSKIANQKPDLIFVDVLMPRLDGYQMCALIRKNPLFSKTPIIMLSAKDSTFDRAKARAAGADEHMSKPFTLEKMLRTAAKFLTATESA